MFDIEFINVSFKYIDSIKRISRNDYFTINDFFFMDYLYFFFAKTLESYFEGTVQIE